ncbi:MAG: DUF4080 domain-containing protein [Methylococcales bacterium]|jgi:radical SAM superfamily enzyme YgiQ (UPF0313 family)|nr:DUF4080 domain-containing protein [Methylococcales bacterium]
MPKQSIILATLNAKFIHTAFGLRYLYANLGALKAETTLLEFTIKQRPLDVVEQLLLHNPKIIGLGVYIWNITELTEVVQLLKALRPDIKVILGGPEISYETDQQNICHLADYVITGEGEVAFKQLVEDLLCQGKARLEKVIPGTPPDLETLLFPYDEYTDDDIKNRVIYIEASRGCPYRCEFCLSSLDKKVRNFPQDAFLTQLKNLYDRGVRQFKFVDRTFNLKINQCLAILQFFLDRLDTPLFVHFEVIPDRLPDALKTTIQQFPEGSLQFEIGVQSLNPEVQTHISRRQDNPQTLSNIQWLREQTQVHMHTDLIIGLPGETKTSFGEGFDQLIAAKPHEIQVGILKRLRGTPIIRHTQEYQMVFSPLPPYDILSNQDIHFDTMQQLRRFARYWDMIGNSGHFPNTRKHIATGPAFERFFTVSNWLFERTGQTHAIALKRLFECLYYALTDALQTSEEEAKAIILADFNLSKLKNKRFFLNSQKSPLAHSTTRTSTPSRQARFSTDS